MTDILASRIEKPLYFRLAPLLRGRGKRSTVVIGFDTEAVTKAGDPDRGMPFLMQFSGPGTDETGTLLVRVPHREHAALRLFVDYLDSYCTRKDTEYIIVGWNLSYEWTQLFRDLTDTGEDAIPFNQLPEFTFDTDRRDDSGNLRSRWRVKVLNDKRYSATFTHLGTKRVVRVIDGMSFFVTGLDKAAGMLGLGAKITLPKGKIKKLTRADADDPFFCRYARQDAYLTRRIGEVIVDLFKEYDVTTCISAPQFAAKVFRHHFLTSEIAQPSPDLEQAGLSSYHGGKNGYYLPGPKHLRKMWHYDITSAYPEAMRALPDPTQAVWVPVTDYVPGRHALYRVSMTYRPCAYRGLQAHDGHKLSTEYVDGVWTTSYELDAIVSQGEADIHAIEGWSMEGPSGGPLVDYVDRFFAMKRNATGPMREAAKLFLNSLYGKFFQKVGLGDVGWWEADQDGPMTYRHDPTEPYDYRAGGLYHPPIASLITGYVRGKIHRLEHRYGAVMTSTDGLFARKPPIPADIGSDLGMLTATRGELSIWRERLYLFDPEDGGKRKGALHGYRGSFDDLAKVPLTTGAWEYTASQLVTLRLAGRTFAGADGVPIRPGTGEIADLKFVLDIRAGRGP